MQSPVTRPDLRALEPPPEEEAPQIQPAEISAPEMAHSRSVRKGAGVGAQIGLIFGMVWLVMSVLIGAGVGALIGKATTIRLEKGTAPRIRFSGSQRES